MPTYIVFFGPPGSGKGTQAKLMEKKFGLPQISTGDLFREMKSLNTPLAKKIQRILADGGLVSDDVTIEMVKERLAKPDCKSGAILDGFPRTLAQAEALDHLLANSFGSTIALVPLFEVGRDETLQRIMERSRKEGRSDDKPEVAETRLKVYEENTAPLIKYYRSKGLLATLDASQSIDTVAAQLSGLIEQKLGKV